MPESKRSWTSEAAVLLCDKPAGVTSHDVVAEIRRELGARPGRRRRGPKVGHAGTLDPFATGLLIILIGRATRLQRFLMALPKTYRATARLGWRSSTGDPDGELIETGRIPEDLELPVGAVEQRLPMTSAVRVEGERLYEKAHRGERIETPLREVQIHSSRLLEVSSGAHGRPERAAYEIVCESGTYVRTLVETLHDAYCEQLRRLAIGQLAVPACGRREIDLSEALAHMTAVDLSQTEAEAIGHGRALRPRPEWPVSLANEVRLIHKGRLLAVGEMTDEELRPTVVLV